MITRLATLFAVAASVLVAGRALAQIELDSYYTGGDSPRIDALLDEWVDEEGNDIVPSLPLREEDRVGGEGAMEGEGDIAGDVFLAHNKKSAFAAFKVVDQRFIRTKKLGAKEDHIEIWFSIGSGKAARLAGVGVYADPSKYRGPVELRWIRPGFSKAGKKIKGAEGAVRGDEIDYTVEVAIPWRAFPRAFASRKGLRAAVFFVDGDMAAHMTRKNILGTAPLQVLEDPEKLPLLLQGDLGAGLASFNESMGLPASTPATFTETANIAGDGKKEDVMVVGGYLVAQGGSIDPGAYVYTQLPIEEPEQVERMKVIDLVGSKRREIVLEFAEETGAVTRRWVEAYRVMDDMAFQKIFAAPLEVDNGSIRITNTYRLVKGPGKTKAFEVKAGAAKGVTEETIGNNVPEEDGNYMVLPWDKPAKAKYVFKDGLYQK